MDLVSFLEARLDDDERDCSIAGEPEDWCDRSEGAHYDSRRVLAEVEAKRAIVAEHGEPDWGPHQNPSPWCRICCDDDPDPDWRNSKPWPCPTLRVLVSVYGDHPDFDPEWALSSGAVR